ARRVREPLALLRRSGARDAADSRRSRPRPPVREARSRLEGLIPSRTRRRAGAGSRDDRARRCAQRVGAQGRTQGAHGGAAILRRHDRPGNRGVYGNARTHRAPRTADGAGVVATGSRSVNLEVERLLDLASAVPASRRPALLAKECPDPELRAEVESLLQYATDAESYFERAIRGVATSVRTGDDPLPRDSFGAYRIVSLLGRGGMGTVYLAERADGEIQQKVAVKLLRADCFRTASRDRFLTERQLLASLQHPSIVHVMDAGHTDQGRPYLV